MKERPILFSGPMVQAILDGRKTQTRRIIEYQPPSNDYQLTTLCSSTSSDDRKHIGSHHWAIVKDLSIVADHGRYFRCRYGKPGDRLWVRETWALNWVSTDVETGYADDWGAVSKQRLEEIQSASDLSGCEYMAYAADPKWQATGDDLGFKWRPSIFMPRWASRITLEITKVRVERLQEITEEDAKAEGVVSSRAGTLTGFGEALALAQFRILWDVINYKRASWESNPWVWVIEFKQVEAANVKEAA